MGHAATKQPTVAPRLRHALQDELFVRGPDGMRPTARAQEIAPKLRVGLDQLQSALAPAAFAEAVTDRHLLDVIVPDLGVEF